jgi:hypothetical protein
MMLDKKKKIYIFSALLIIAILILGYFSCSNVKSEKEKYAELKKKVDDYYTMECDSIKKIIIADSILTEECINFLNRYPKSIHFNEIKYLVGKNLDYKVGNCFKESIRKFLYEHQYDCLNQSVALEMNDSLIATEIDSILLQKENLKQYYDKKEYDIVALEKQLNYKKSNCLFPKKWIASKQVLYEQIKKNAFETAFNSLGALEKTKNDIDNLEYVIYKEDSTVKLINTPSQERIVQYDIVFAIKLRVLPSSIKESRNSIFAPIFDFLNDGSAVITDNFPPTTKLVSVSGYTIGKVNYDNAAIEMKQNVSYDSSKIIN